MLPDRAITRRGDHNTSGVRYPGFTGLTVELRARDEEDEAVHRGHVNHLALTIVPPSITHASDDVQYRRPRLDVPQLQPPVSACSDRPHHASSCPIYRAVPHSADVLGFQYDRLWGDPPTFAMVQHAARF